MKMGKDTQNGKNKLIYPINKSKLKAATLYIARKVIAFLNQAYKYTLISTEI